MTPRPSVGHLLCVVQSAARMALAGTVRWLAGAHCVLFDSMISRPVFRSPVKAGVRCCGVRSLAVGARDDRKPQLVDCVCVVSTESREACDISGWEAGGASLPCTGVGTPAAWLLCHHAKYQ